MRILIFTILTVLIFKSSYCQYAGENTKDILNRLSTAEKELFYEAIKESDQEIDSLVWMMDSTNQNLISDYKYYTTKVIRRHFNKKKNSCHIIPGKHSLKRPECIYFINRQEDDTVFIFQVYY
jgi:hypothetical protein